MNGTRCLAATIALAFLALAAASAEAPAEAVRELVVQGYMTGFTRIYGDTAPLSELALAVDQSYRSGRLRWFSGFEIQGGVPRAIGAGIRAGLGFQIAGAENDRLSATLTGTANAGLLYGLIFSTGLRAQLEYEHRARRGLRWFVAAGPHCLMDAVPDQHWKYSAMGPLIGATLSLGLFF